MYGIKFSLQRKKISNAVNMFYFMIKRTGFEIRYFGGV